MHIGWFHVNLVGIAVLMILAFVQGMWRGLRIRAANKEAARKAWADKVSAGRAANDY